MENSDSITETPDTPGARLRAAREAEGLTPREMSDRLNWLPAHVTAIEENRYEELRGAAFVRGYLRAYARAVSLDEDEIVAGYTSMFPGQEDVVQPVTTAPADNQKAGWSVVAGTVLAVLVIGWIWWQQQQAPDATQPAVIAKPETRAAEPEATESETTEPAVIEAEAAATEEVVSEPATPESVPMEVAGEPAAPQVTAVESDTAEAIASVAEPAMAEPEVESADEPQSPVEAPAVPQVDSVDEPAPEMDRGALVAARGHGEGPLEFSFSADCWLEVRDGEDQLIYANLHGAGDQISLDGEPPFRVLAGNASALSVSYRGESVEVVTRPGRDTARFSVGEQ